MLYKKNFYSGVFFLDSLNSTSEGKAIILIASLISILPNIFNLFINMNGNKRFFEEFKYCFCCKNNINRSSFLRSSLSQNINPNFIVDSTQNHPFLVKRQNALSVCMKFKKTSTHQEDKV